MGAKLIRSWAVYAGLVSTIQWSTPLTRLAGADGGLLISAEVDVREGLSPSYFALYEWSRVVCSHLLGGGSGMSVMGEWLQPGFVC